MYFYRKINLVGCFSTNDRRGTCKIGRGPSGNTRLGACAAVPWSNQIGQSDQISQFRFRWLGSVCQLRSSALEADRSNTVQGPADRILLSICQSIPWIIFPTVKVKNQCLAFPWFRTKTCLGQMGNTHCCFRTLMSDSFNQPIRFSRGVRNLFSSVYEYSFISSALTAGHRASSPCGRW